MKDYCYKIYNSETGLFQREGKWIRWNKHGKFWIGSGRCRNHLNLFKQHIWVDVNGNEIPYQKGCEIKYVYAIKDTWIVYEFELVDGNYIKVREVKAIDFLFENKKGIK